MNNYDKVLFEENWQNATLSNDFIFAKVMSNKDYCKELIEIILGVKISKLVYEENQKAISLSSDGKSVRFDVYTETDDKVFDIEMQVAEKLNLPKRTRYYQGMMDLNLIKLGEDYSELKESYIIFICLFDLFNAELPVYTFQNRCDENQKLLLGDEACKIFINTTAYEKCENENLKALLNYLQTHKPTDLFTKSLDETVEVVKQNKEWRMEYMTLLMRDREKFEMGVQKGIEKGIEKGVEKGKLETAKELLKENIPMSIIIKSTGLTEEQILNLKNE